MTATREGHVVPVAEPSDRGASLAVKGRPGEAAALHRLEASRARIQGAMEAHLRESALSKDPPRVAPRSLGQRLLERARRLPLVRTALAIRELGRG